MDPFQKYLDPLTLAKLKDLPVRSNRLVEGRMSGAHRSPFQGASVEFAEHREYMPGDDVRNIDWKVFAKTERHYLKRFELETNLILNLVIDCSQSMTYLSPGATMSKHDYACRMAATLAYLTLHQQDTVGLTLFEERIRYFVQPSNQATTLKQMLHLLDLSQPGKDPGKVGDVLNELASRLHQRSLLVILSDGFDDLEKIERGLKHLRHRRHEVVFFQVLDPQELDFQFDPLTLFKGLEAMPELLVEPKSLRQAYLQAFGKFVESLKGLCRGSNVEYRQARTDVPLWRTLSSFLLEHH